MAQALNPLTLLPLQYPQIFEQETRWAWMLITTHGGMLMKYQFCLAILLISGIAYGQAVYGPNGEYKGYIQTHLTVSIIHIAPLEHFKVPPKCKVTKQISTGPRGSIREIFRRRFTHLQIQPSEHPHR